MSDFDKLLEEELEKLKKKKKQTVTPSNTLGNSLSYLPSYNKLTASDIAPVLRTTRVKEKEDDVAPVKTKEDDSKLDFFQKGAFSDGYQFGDVTKSILGTVGDAGLGVVKGVMGLGEGVGDLITYGVAGVADIFGKDDFADRVKKNAQENAIDDLFSGADNYLNKYSVLARTSDAILQGVGQVGGIMATGGLGAAAGLGSVGTTALTTGTMGLSGMGSGMGEAYKGGATDGEALAYGAISGAADALTELLFGGLGKAVNAVGLSKGLSSADDMLAKKVSNLFKSQIAKNISEFGIKAGAEGFEEVLAGIAQGIGKHITYADDKKLSEIMKDENLLEQFIVGAVTSGIAQAPSLHIANKTKTDFVTGQTQQEQDVLKKVVEDRIAELEAKGTTLTKKQMGEIEADVLQDMEKGFIPTETIEEILGGENYTAYQDMVKQDNEALAELAELYEGDELKQRAEEFITNSKRHELAKTLSDSVYDMVKDTRLGESYRDRARRGQLFQADTTKYDEKQRVTIQRAIDSGVLNNTNRTHDMVDFIARLSADTGVLFDFTNNEKLKDTIYAVNGKTVDGYITKDGITINVNSPRYINTIVGHEITHAFEGTKQYEALEKALFEYAKEKGNYKDVLKDAYELYHGEEGYEGYEGLKKIKKEAVANLVGDYLFTDKNFVNHLSANHPNIFQKAWNKVKYMVKIARAGSDEAKKLLEVQKAFEDAYRNGGKTVAETKHSLSPVEAVQPKSEVWHRTATTEEAMAKFPNMWNVAAEESEVRNPTQIRTTVKTYRNIYDILKSEGFNGTILDASSGLGDGTKAGIEEYGFNVEDIEPYPDKGYNPKYQDYSTLDKKYDVIISNAVLNVLPQDQRDALVVKMGELLNDGGRMFINVRGKDVESLAKTGKNIHLGKMEWIETVKGSYQKGFTTDELKAYLEDALGEGYTVDKTNKFGGVSVIVTKDGGVKYSLSKDSDGKQLTKEQQEYFKDSKVVDENGNLLTVYHGTPRGGFTEFNHSMIGSTSDYGYLGRGFYFTSRERVAKYYAGYLNSSEVKKGYLNITNPFVIHTKPNKSDLAFTIESIMGQRFGGEDADYERSVAFTEWLKDNGYDGVICRDEIMALDSNQFKNADNVNPTADPDIRYSLSNDKQDMSGATDWNNSFDYWGESISEGQAKYFADSVVRIGGKLVPVYHGTGTDINSFDRGYSDRHSKEDQGLFWAAFDKEYADDYSDGVVKKGYLNIKEILDIGNIDGYTSYDKRAEEISRLINVSKEDIDAKMEEKGYDYIYQLTGSKWFMDKVVENGYDGVLAWESGLKTFGFVDSNQFKNVDNTTPTSDSDIRYSISAEQKEYFKDSVVRDENGNLKVMYHGTSKGGFYSFDTYGSNYGLFGTGSYFTDSKTVGESYTKKGRGNNPQVYEAYLNITNPLDMDAPANPTEWAEAFDEVDFPESGTNEDFYRAVEEYYADQYMAKWEVAEIIRDSIQFGMGYDGLTHIGGGRVNPNGERHRVYIAFEPEQIKRIDNVKPTTDPDIRYSLSDRKKLKDVGLDYDAKNETVSYSMSSLEDAFDYNKSEADYLASRLEYETALAKSIAEDKENVTKEEMGKAKRYLDSLFLIHDMIAMDRDRLDYEAAVGKSAWVSNAEYGGSIDFSTLCAKRRLFTGTFDAIQNELPDTVLDENDFLQIRNMLLEKELESPCSMCYVEGSRAKHGVYVAKFLKEYKQTNPEWIPQIADFTSTTRLEQTRINHPEAYQAYVDAMNKLSQRKPKEASVRTDYRGEILRDFKDTSTVAEKNKNGGVRFNSFSDFEVIHAIDCMQVLTDMARVGLNGQAYTKVKEFAEAFGNTGLKINLSLVAKDVDENGKLIMDETNGMKYDEAMDLRNRYSDNVGTVIVVFNEAQLRAALADNTIDYVLPFHRSQWRKSQYTMMGLPVSTKDFTNYQNDRIKNPNTGRDVKLSKIKHISHYTNDITGETFEIKDNIMPNQYWDFNLDGRGNAQRYLDYINANGMTPKFNFLLDKVDGKWVLPEGAVGDGYFKVLIDFKMYNNDGWGSPQNPVVPEFNMPFIQQMLENYKGGHQAFPVAHDVVSAFVEGKKSGKFSLSNDDTHPIKQGNWHISGKDVAYEEIAPVDKTKAVAKNATTEELFPDDLVPGAEDDADTQARLASLDEADMPPEMEAPYTGEPSTPVDPFANRDIKEVGNQKVKAYMYENPEVKPFFQAEANIMLGELRDTVKGERIYQEDGSWTGTSRHTSDDIAYLRDSLGYSYAEIEKGLNAIIEDNGKENIAVAKRIEFVLHDRLSKGYTDFNTEMEIPADQDYINLLNEKRISEYSEEAFARFIETADQYAPPADDIAPVAPAKEEYLAVTPKRKKEPKMVRVDKPVDQKTANILAEEPKVQKKKNGLWSMVKENVLDNGMVFEDLALKTKNRDLQAKWNYIRYSQSRAQKLIGDGADGVKSLDSIRKEVEKSGKTQKFYEYLYHWLNVDRMTLEDRYEDTPNKAVFGDSVTADMSRVAAVQLGKENPEFRRWAQDVYRYNRHLRNLMVEQGVISQETADLWAEMYPHYVPIRRIDDDGLNINVPLDTGRTGVNAPIKRATGGNSDILPLFDTMAQRTLQTYKAIAKNSFGVELKNALGTTITKEQTDVDGVIDSMDNHEGLLQEGKNGRKPTFTVFENGEKVTFEITDEMYNAMKPASDLMSYTNPVANTISNVHRGLLTEYNPVFMATNAIKDTQDILINSQHPVKTYANLPRATWELAKNGKWFREYMENGGEDNSYFDSDTNSFDTEEKGVRKLLGIPPLSWISKANNFIERTPRLAEYIASREAGRSIEVSMLDAARVTTNFAAGGKLTKFANRNGATFLNASVQGAVQQARNIREAKANGLKGWAQLAGKFALAGLPAVLLNGLMWDDDDDYEELSDYVKQNYYIVGKYGDGKFVRIPKGRTLAVIQNAIEQVVNAATGNDEVDLKSFLELAISNLAPNNPIENNILAPIIQVAKNETWYGEDLVPTRLQDLPAAEQFDESTDAISKWLGEKLNYSPYKINYLLDQYSGGIGDTILPMLTPEAESGDNSLIGNMIAPLKSKFTTDSVMNNQNVSDFYETKEELTTNAKASTATDEDVLMNKYVNSINAELSELYARKREIQNSRYSDSLKYSMVRDIQKQIVDLTKESLETYKDVSINGEYATVGDRYYKKNDEGEWQKMSDEQVTKHKVTSSAGDSPYATDGKNHYRFYVKEGETEGEWRKITDEQLEKQNEVTKALGISAVDYWGNKEEYDYAYEYPESYAVAKAVGGYESYKTYSDELYDIKADKDENGKSISGSRKEKVIDYINNLDVDYYTKIILFKNEYNADDTYNEDIVEYLNSRDDISYSEMVTILKKLGFTVSKDGTVTW
jgi:hypothetical protein